MIDFLVPKVNMHVPLLSQIDREVILLMEDADLAKYLPSYGDRIALKHFCRRQTPSAKRKLGLFEKLREKMKLRKAANEDEEEPQTSNKKQAAKQNQANEILKLGGFTMKMV